jgi:hypothetical protein
VSRGAGLHEGGDNHEGDAHEDVDQGWVPTLLVITPVAAPPKKPIYGTVYKRLNGFLNVYYRFRLI